jgi:hypothetical protein
MDTVFGASGGSLLPDFFLPRSLSFLLMGCVGDGGPGDTGRKGTTPDAYGELTFGAAK